MENAKPWYKQWWFWVIACVSAPFILLMSCAVCVGAVMELGEDSVSSSSPARNDSRSLVDEFGCQWIMDTFRPMTLAGRDAAIMHVSNSMNAEKISDVFDYVSVGDAAAAVRTCEARGY